MIGRVWFTHGRVPVYRNQKSGMWEAPTRTNMVVTSDTIEGIRGLIDWAWT